jgi:predicted nucleic acid-binding protein
MRVLVDNDVVLDIILQRAPFDVEAKELFLKAGRTEITIFIAAITPINAFYTIRKERDKQTARTSIQGLLKLVEICRTDKQVSEDAFALGFSDYEDAVQCSSAIAENLDAIVTRNAKDFKNSPIPVYSPSQFLELLKESKTD